VKQLVNMNGKVNVDVSALAKGIYFVKVQNGSQSATKRIDVLK
ncbi:MAG: T9SS type A sorting domain-containing protein, partial [Sphingobacteriales bacterium]